MATFLFLFCSQYMWFKVLLSSFVPQHTCPWATGLSNSRWMSESLYQKAFTRHLDLVPPMILYQGQGSPCNPDQEMR